jgi:hypothetical protein
MTSRKAFPMTEYVPTPEDDELEATTGGCSINWKTPR